MSKYTRDPIKIDKMVKVAAKADKISEVLFEHADKQLNIQRIIKFANFVVGAAVAYLSLSITDIDLNKMLALLAAVFIFADTGLPLILGEANPERFRDYASYVQYYKRVLEELQIDDELDTLAWNARVMELTNLASRNIDDVLGKWPWIKKKI